MSSTKDSNGFFGLRYFMCIFYCQRENIPVQLWMRNDSKTCSYILYPLSENARKICPYRTLPSFLTLKFKEFSKLSRSFTFHYKDSQSSLESIIFTVAVIAEGYRLNQLREEIYTQQSTGLYYTQNFHWSPPHEVMTVLLPWYL